MTAEPTPLPPVTVIMPVRNEEAYIERSLGAVLRQSYGLDRLEILLVDGLSEDRTRQLARDLAEARGADLRILDNPGRTAPCAMNVGLRQARGEVIVRVDGHCEIGEHYVAHAVRRLVGGEADGVGGPLETVGETETARAIAAAMGSRFGVGGVAFRTSGEGAPDREVDTVAFPAYRRDVIARAGAFDEELRRNQDDEYNYRLRKLGARLVLAGDMPARYYSRGTYRSLARQYFQYGVYKVRVLQKHPRQMRPRQFVPAAFMLGLLLSAVLWPWLGPWPLALILGAYAVANLSAAAITARGGGPGRFLRLPPAFVLLHFGYGLGFLVGLVRFARRWGDAGGRIPSLGWGAP
ncbi:MAG: glycosyltransferase family 2 protein [Acidobacteriota bacterium]